jgi:hypothetical protein
MGLFERDVLGCIKKGNPAERRDFFYDYVLKVIAQ